MWASPLATVEPDATGAMWRVRLPDGSLTDLVNLTRAKDALKLRTSGALNDRRFEDLYAQTRR